MTVQNGPTIATVIPVLNEEGHIGKCLESLISQDHPAHDHIILVLDGGSSDNTISEIESMIKKSKQIDGPLIELATNPGKHVSNARNLALNLIPASVTHLIELIGHCVVPQNHISTRMRSWQKYESQSKENNSNPLGALGVKVLSRKGKLGMFESWVEGALSSPLGSGAGQFDNFNSSSTTKIPAFAMHLRSAVMDVGGWDEDFISCQDSDLSMRMIEQGYRLMRCPETTVSMAKRTSLSRWWKMGHRYGFWRTKIVLRHPKRISLREYAPWFGVILSAILCYVSNDYWMIPAMMYGVVLIAEALRISIINRRFSLIIGIPMCLFMLHTSFSIGLLDGLIRKGKASSDR
ncbi:MAG: glycosyltransferase [Candidatus Poseidoniaceae archaeon]|nr:glycosyltransferase [Candidatus Poseidoniaceae archaeon]